MTAATWEQPLIDSIIDVKRKLEDMKRHLGNNQEFLKEYGDTKAKVESAQEAISHLVGTLNRPQ
jgi:predicted nuclease with TOPRIM domain